MGSFNVACSISHLSIDPGEKIVFIPLLADHYKKTQDGRVNIKPKSYLLHANECYNPFSLPIKGYYGDYGLLEDIEHDETVEAIEHFFGMSISDFIDSVTGRKGMDDRFSGMFKQYSVKQDVIDSYDFPFGDDYLMELGFQKEQSNGNFIHDRFPQYQVKAYEVESEFPNYYGFVIFDENGNELEKVEGQQCKKEILRKYYKLAGEWLNAKPEDQEKIKIINELAGMFVHGDIYDALSKRANEYMSDWYDEVLEEVEKYQEAVERGDKEIQNKRGRKENIKFYEKFEYPLGEHGYRNFDFFRFFDGWDYFLKLYKPYIERKEMKNTFISFSSFVFGMSSANAFYFPSQNGEQHGNLDVTKLVLEKSLNIVNEKLKEREG